MAAPAGTIESTVRLLVPGDEIVLETHLSQQWSTSQLLRANFRSGGLSDEGEYTQGSYGAVFEGDTMVAVAVHYREGTLMVEAPRALAQAVRAAIADSGRPVERVVGAWSQVNAAANLLGATPKKPFLGRPLSLMTCQLSRLRAGALKRTDARPRLATEADLNTLSSWQAAYDAPPNVQPSPDAVKIARGLVQERIAAERLFVTEAITQTRPQLVAMATCEALLSESAHIGGVYAPPAVKDKIYEPVAALGAILAAQKLGVNRVTVVAEKTNVKAIEAYRTLGLVPMDEFGTLTAPD